MLHVPSYAGPITGGVLRGERARFQLFGDTVNTCSSIAKGGEKDRIHISKETADLIKAAGWCVRTDLVEDPPA